ncbi:MAG: nucleotidyl transferase AbiEii/AbiGii toxin family protein [Deltaproteobacteria bacterium]|nr:nucleotidyl transferase AbiEii/AbiGii toxin family protein [Deltaproteobacteria bacterium]
MWLPETEKVLNILSEEEDIKDYVFVGGSALSYYLNHRLSEDIDLASPEEFLKMDNSIDRITSNLSKKDLAVIEKPDSASRHYERNIYANDVKITFYASNERFLQNQQNTFRNNLKIADLDALIAMKGMVIHNRAALRDYYDLYSLTVAFGFEKIIDETQKFYNTDKLTRFNKANFLQEIVNLETIKEETIESYLKPIYNVSKTDLEMFFLNKTREYISQQFRKNKEEEIKNSQNKILDPPNPVAPAQDIKNQPKPTIKFRR